MYYQFNLLLSYLNRVLSIRIIIIVDAEKKVFAQPWDDPRLFVVVAFPHHGVAFASSGLTVGKNAHIVSWNMRSSQ